MCVDDKIIEKSWLLVFNTFSLIRSPLWSSAKGSDEAMSPSCARAIFKFCVKVIQCKHRWFNGRMLACHAGDPGVIAGWFIFESFGIIDARTFQIVHYCIICNNIYCNVSPTHFEQGSKQRCSLAMLLYVIYIETLLLKYK